MMKVIPEDHVMMEKKSYNWTWRRPMTLAQAESADQDVLEEAYHKASQSVDDMMGMSKTKSEEEEYDINLRDLLTLGFVHMQRFGIVDKDLGFDDYCKGKNSMPYSSRDQVPQAAENEGINAEDEETKIDDVIEAHDEGVALPVPNFQVTAEQTFDGSVGDDIEPLLPLESNFWYAMGKMSRDRSLMPYFGLSPSTAHWYSEMSYGRMLLPPNVISDVYLMAAFSMGRRRTEPYLLPKQFAFQFRPSVKVPEKMGFTYGKLEKSESPYCVIPSTVPDGSFQSTIPIDINHVDRADIVTVCIAVSGGKMWLKSGLYFRTYRGPPKDRSQVVSYHYEASPVSLVSYVIVEEEDDGDFVLTPDRYASMPLVFRRIVHSYYLGRRIGRGTMNDLSESYHALMGEPEEKDISMAHCVLHCQGSQPYDLFTERVAMEMGVGLKSFQNVLDDHPLFVVDGDMVRARDLDIGSSISSSGLLFEGMILEDVLAAWELRPPSLYTKTKNDFCDCYFFRYGDL